MSRKPQRLAQGGNRNSPTNTSQKPKTYSRCSHNRHVIHRNCRIISHVVRGLSLLATPARPVRLPPGLNPDPARNEPVNLPVRAGLPVLKAHGKVPATRQNKQSRSKHKYLPCPNPPAKQCYPRLRRGMKPYWPVVGSVNPRIEPREAFQSGPTNGHPAGGGGWC